MSVAPKSLDKLTNFQNIHVDSLQNLNGQVNHKIILTGASLKIRHPSQLEAESHTEVTRPTETAESLPGIELVDRTSNDLLPTYDYRSAREVTSPAPTNYQNNASYSVNSGTSIELPEPSNSGDYRSTGGFENQLAMEPYYAQPVQYPTYTNRTSSAGNFLGIGNNATMVLELLSVVVAGLVGNYAYEHRGSQGGTASFVTPTPTPTPAPTPVPAPAAAMPMVTISDISGATLTGTTQNTSAGDTVTVTISDLAMHSITETTVVNADGSYTLSNNLSSLTDGSLSAVVTVKHGANAGSATGSGSLEAIPDSITLNVPNVSPYIARNAYPISGSTSDIAAGATVTLVIQDGDGPASMTATTLVQADGHYAVVADLSPLPPGDIAATATVREATGDVVTQTAHMYLLTSSFSSIQSTPPVLVDATNVLAVPMSGTSTNVSAGATVTVVISDQAAHHVTATTTINVDGTFQVTPNLSSLTDGALSIGTTVTSAYGTNSSNQTTTMEAIPDLVSLSWLSSAMLDTSVSSVKLTGSTSDIPVGASVTISISDTANHGVTSMALVLADHTYTSTSNLSSLSVGVINATAHAMEVSGEVITSSGSAIQIQHVVAASVVVPTPQVGSLLVDQLSAIVHIV